MKELPIGVENFRKIVEKGYYFVDKSLLIKDIIELPGEIKLITRPRRFGKTLNLSMMKSFFSIEEKEELFGELKIWKEKGIVKDYFHKFPVVSITFKELKDVTWKDALDHIKTVISNIVEYYTKVLKSTNFQRWAEKIIEGNAPISEYIDSLRNITQALHEETGKRAILLIDEYDVPIEAAYTYRYKDADYYDNMVAFMRNMLTGALKGNEYLEFGIMTGVYRVAKESIFSGLNNLAVFTVFDNKIPTMFGFTEDEVMEMLNHYKLNSEEDKEILNEWYGGYKIGKYQPLYNPWSVISYIDQRLSGSSPEESSQPFWINTSSNDIVKQQIENNPQLKGHLDSLLEGKEIVQNVDPWLSLRELEEAPEGVWTLLVSGGYLKATMQERNMYLLETVNREIEEFFKITVKRWLSRAININMSELYVGLMTMLKEGKEEGFRHHLEKFVKSTLSYYDIGFEEPERVYKAFLLGMLSIAINGFEVENELESGLGRLDVVVYPKEKRHGRYAAIFEVKRAEDKEKVKQLSERALKQAREMQYYAKVRDRGYKVILFGIAFSGKAACVKSEVVG